MVIITELFDLHCDTVTKAFKLNKSLYDGEMHINLKKAGYIKKYRQCFALWLSDSLKGRSAFSFCLKLIDFYKGELSLLDKKGVTNLYPLLTIENGSALSGDSESIPFFSEKGVRMITLTWNGENEIGQGVGADSGKGLTPFGKNAVRIMEKENIKLDVSHLNEQGFKDILSFASEPFAASHSGCYSLLPHKRNLKDWQIKEIINSGGIIGVPYCNTFIEGGKEKVYEHIRHILSLGGEDNVALGSDFDGCEINKELSGIEKVGELYKFLAESDIGKAITEKIFHINAERFFQVK